MASKNSVRRARRGITSPPTARASSRAALWRRAQTATEAPARAKANAADVVRVRACERAVAADYDGVDGADVGGESIALFQIFQDSLFVRKGDAEAANTKLRDGAQKIA